MKEASKVSSEGTKRDFPSQAAIVLLTAVIITESTSLTGWSTSLAGSLPSPLATPASLLVCSTSLIAILGLLQRSLSGLYLGLLASVLITVLAAFSLLEAGTVWLAPPYPLTSAASALFLGPLLSMSLGFSRIGQASKTTVKRAHTSTPSEKGSFTLETIDVSKKYFVGSTVVSAVDGVSMQIRKGEFMAIMGPSGSGKSTLLNLLGALDKPFSGRVLIDGIDISSLDETGLAKLRNEKIGFVFQAYNLIARSSVLRNMELPAFVKGYSKEERVRMIKDLLKIVGLSDKLLRKPKTLSGGEQQRVAIARALVNSPEIVLADEPTGNVDSKQGQIIMEFLRKLNREKSSTIIVVTHDPEVAKMADRIVYIRDGQILEEEIVGD